ncbi:MAG: hypothetical protein FWD15_03570 [Alphaproteobacteria bacterium]|nr:hypothetical protein [Alphaproteobacteria bacterium]
MNSFPIPLVESLIKAEKDFAEKVKNYTLYGDKVHKDILIPAMNILCEHCGKHKNKAWARG